MVNDWRAKWFDRTDGETDPMFPFGQVQVFSLRGRGRKKEREKAWEIDRQTDIDKANLPRINLLPATACPK